MARPKFPQTLPEFHRAFSTEEACLEYLAASRWPDGFRCPGCNGSTAYRTRRRRLWQCRTCRLQTSATAGTVLHRTRQPLSRWFHAAFLVSTLTPGISALQLKRQLGIPSYGSAWSMLHRLRRAMQKPQLERLRGPVEVDETYIGASRRGARRGRGDPRKVPVAGAVECRGAGSGRLRLEVIPAASAAALIGFVGRCVEPGATVHTDAWRAYAGLREAGYVREAELAFDGHVPTGILPRIHRAFSNLKTWLAGTHHGVDPQYLPRYLREFEFRFNRRQSPMAAFQTLLGLAGSTPPPPRHRR